MKHKFIWLQSLPVLLGIICSISIVLAIYQLQHQFQKPLHVKKIVQQLTMIQPLLPLLAPITGQLHQEPEFKEEKNRERAPPVGELGLDVEAWQGRTASVWLRDRSILAGNGGSIVLWYGGQIKNKLEDGLQILLADTPAMRFSYKVIIEVWVDAEGHISCSEMTSQPISIKRYAPRY